MPPEFSFVRLMARFSFPQGRMDSRRNHRGGVSAQVCTVIVYFRGILFCMLGNRVCVGGFAGEGGETAFTTMGKVVVCRL